MKKVDSVKQVINVDTPLELLLRERIDQAIDVAAKFHNVQFISLGPSAR
jgi:hypothetical protein